MFPNLFVNQLTALKVLISAGVIRPYPPHVLIGIAQTLRDWGRGPAGGFTTLAQRSPHQVGVIDELGSLTFQQMHRRSNALAHALRELGIDEGDSVALLCRNHRGFLESAVAVSKLGADVLYLNTAFSAPQIGEVCQREEPAAIIYDEEFTELVDESGIEGTRVLAWQDSTSTDLATTEDLIEAGGEEDLDPPEHKSRSVILTSGTTGTPKGAPRSEGSFDAGVVLLSRLPLKRGWTCHIAAPLFHTWGWAHLSLAMLMGTTVVLRRTFDPEQCLRVVAENECDSLAVIPLMLQRIMALPEETLRSYDLSRVKVVAASGSALPGDLSSNWMDQFGENLYNIYGSTEVAWATIATPADLRAVPGTAGEPPHGTVVKVYGEDEREAAQGEAGRIFVGNSMLIDGYTCGGSKHMIDGLMATGDVGRFDAEGHLIVEGRDDEMIVSGGENVFPQEVESSLARHDAVVEVAVLGVDDEEFGERLRAFVVLTSPDAASEDDLKEHVRSNLARYKVPRDFVFLDELPRNVTGKILKRELAERDPEHDAAGHSD
ncbi:MAG: AMP-binding protein [Actinomycetota bacterium]|nr:AMP-binding protein [Actinomycetota bacterium]